MKFTFEELINRLPADLVQSLKDCMQDKTWHPEGSVYTHCEMVFDYAVKHSPEDNEVILAAIFHDLGKPETTRKIVKDGRTKITHYGHEMASLKYIDKYFHLYSDISTDKEKVYEICKNHMRAHLFSSGKITKRKKVEDFESNKYFSSIMNFSICDEKGRG